MNNIIKNINVYTVSFASYVFDMMESNSVTAALKGVVINMYASGSVIIEV